MAGFRILSGMILHKLLFFKRVAFLCFWLMLFLILGEVSTSGGKGIGRCHNELVSIAHALKLMSLSLVTKVMMTSVYQMINYHLSLFA